MATVRSMFTAGKRKVEHDKLVVMDKKKAKVEGIRTEVHVELGSPYVPEATWRTVQVPGTR